MFLKQPAYILVKQPVPPCLTSSGTQDVRRALLTSPFPQRFYALFVFPSPLFAFTSACFFSVRLPSPRCPGFPRMHLLGRWKPSLRKKFHCLWTCTKLATMESKETVEVVVFYNTDNSRQYIVQLIHYLWFIDNFSYE